MDTLCAEHCDKLAGCIVKRDFAGVQALLAPEPVVHEEQNACGDVWLVAVEHEGRVVAGYLEAAEAT